MTFNGSDLLLMSSYSHLSTSNDSKSTIMKYLFVTAFLLISCLGYSQLTSCSSDAADRANPRLFLMEVEELRMAGQYDSIIAIVESRIEEGCEVLPYYYHQLACFHALKKNYDESIENVLKAVDAGVSINDVLTDTDIELLYTLPGWTRVEDTIAARYLRDNPGITDIDLSLKLWRMGIEDQRYRTLKQNNKKYGRGEGLLPYSSMSTFHEKKEKENLSFVKDLVRKGRWPLYSQVGKEAGDAAFLIVQHSGDQRLTKQALPLVEKAAKMDEASKRNYALMLDRYLMHQNKKQIYGSQASCYSKSIDQSGNLIMGEKFLWPIEDEINVNARRKEMGMNSIEENSKRLGVEYKYDPAHETMTCKELIKIERKKVFD